MVLRGRIKFRSREHAQLLIDVCSDIRRRKAHGPEEDFTAMVGGIFLAEGCFLYCGQKTGACLSVVASTVNRTELYEHKCRDIIFLQYFIETPDLPQH